MRPFPIYPLYTRTVILSLDKPIADCFLFRPRKSCEKRRKRSHTNVSNTLVTRPSTPPAQTAHVCFRGRKWAHTRLCSKDRTQRLTRRNGECFGWDAIITLDTSCTFTNIPGPGVRTANFAVFGSWPGVLPKNAESLRDSDALMRVAVPRRRGPAGLRDLFRFCRNCGLYALRSGPFRVCEARGGITTLSALYVLLKRRTAACQNGSFAVF